MKSFNSLRYRPVHCLCLGLVLLLQMTGQALTPGGIIIWQCPGCRGPLKEYTIGSGNTFGAKFWTDGKMEAPMLPDREPVVKCPKCAHVFWRDKAKRLASIGLTDADADAQYEKWQQAPDPGSPTEQDLLEFGKTAKLTSAERITVCRRAWWRANDLIRNNPQASAAKFSSEQLRSLELLSSLLDEAKPWERITKAELARELQNFEASKHLLAAPFTEPEQKRRADFVRKLAEEKDPLVCQFPPSR